MRVTIIGLGLIGGSLGLALKQARGTEIEVVGFARKAETAVRAAVSGAIDRSSDDLASSVQGSSIVFICTPVMAVEEIMRALVLHVPAGCLVTDTASTKQQVMSWARQYLYPGIGFVGGHPMAGKETYGIEAADPVLLQGCTYCLTPAEWTDAATVKLAEQAVKSMGAQPLFIEAQKHDFLVAGISHLPTLVSAAIVAATTRSTEWPLMAKLAATGYRDVTRLASGNPEVNSDIFATNREALVQWIDELNQVLDQFREQLSRRDADFRRTLEQVRRARETWLETRSPRKC